ncbi:hypothetical protein JW930_00190 [Candidatus Woesearchaeota archaeon]|nr:hypothetical protein [Candidatus Woesearchaeota archaeon]
MTDIMTEQKSPQRQQPKTAPDINIKLSREINEIMRRLRILEERYTNLRKKNQLTDQNMLDTSKKIMEELKISQSTITELKRELQDMNSKITVLAEEIQSCVPKRDFDMVSRYLDFWEPMNFLSREESEKIVQEFMRNTKTYLKSKK